MPKVSAAARSARRQQLIEAGWRCAARTGYRDTTVEDVCAEAGVSKGAFYGYFDSKQELLLALLDDDGAQLDAIIAGLEGRGLAGLEKLRRFTRSVLERGADQGLVQVRADLWAAMLTERTIRRRVAETVGRRRATLRAWIEEASPQSVMAGVPANAWASLLLALWDGLTIHGALDPSAFRWGNIARGLDALLACVERPPEPGRAAAR